MACGRHPRAPVGWECSWCKGQLCADCVARRDSGFSQLDVCVRCGGPAQVLRRLRSEIPYIRRIADAWRYPFQGGGLWAIAGAAVVLWVLVKLGAGGWANAILWAYVFSLIRANANGSSTIEAPDFSDLTDDLVMPAVRGLVATAVVWLPAVLYVQFVRPDPVVDEPAFAMQAEVQSGRAPLADPFAQTEFPYADAEPGFDEEADAIDDPAFGAGLPSDEEAAPVAEKPARPPPPLHRDPIFLFIVLFGVLYAPMALLVAATGGSVWQMLNPIHVVAYTLRIPGDYAVAVGACTVLAVVAGILSFVGKLVGSLPIPVFAGIAGEAFSTYVPFVTGRVLGLLLWVHGATLGGLPPEEAYEPVLADVEPRGIPPETERPPIPEGPPTPANQRPTEISLDESELAPGAPPGGFVPDSPQPAYQRPTAIELDEPELPPDANPGALLAGAAYAGAARMAHVELPPEPQVDPATALSQAIAQRDFDRAVELYREMPNLPVQALPAAGHFGVGRTAAFKGDYPLAVRALKASIAAGPNEPDTPRAYVMIARIHAEKLGDAAMAEKVYRYVVHRFPGTEAAKFAQQRLQSPS